MSDHIANDRLLALTADIVSAHVSNNSITPDAVTSLITAVYQTLMGVGAVVEAPEKQAPAVPIKKSVFPDYIVCLEDGKKLKMLKRHLATSYDMTPDDYRAKWGLPNDYPMVAPAYASTRSALAKSIGLGRKRVIVDAPAMEDLKPVKGKRGPKKAA